jgi:hypothetical protein
MVSTPRSNSAVFSALPVEDDERVIGDDHSILAPVIESSPDQILDGLLTRVGYGLFQKKLLVRRSSLLYCTYSFLHVKKLGFMWVWLVSR